MKLFKTISVALLLTVGLSGCYTQLQYTQQPRKITDRESVDEYSWDGEEGVKADEDTYVNENGTTTARGDDDYYEDEEYIPVYYEDYETAQYWENCNCNPYSYNQGYNDGFFDARSSYGPPILSIGLGLGTYGYGSRFAFRSGYRNPSWYYSSRFWFQYYYGPASPLRYYSYYSPFFYDPFFYDPFFYRPYHGFGFSRFGFGGVGFGTVFVDRNEPERRYGRRGSSGSSRIRSGDRSARTRTEGTKVRSTRTRSKSGERVRSRSNSGSRSRGEVKRTRTRSRGSGRVTPTRTRSRGGSSGSVGRSRSNGRSSGGTRSRGGSVERDRNNDESISRVGFSDNRDIRRKQVRARTLRRIDRSKVNKRQQNVRRPNRQRSSGGFWGRLKNTLKSSSRNVIRNSSRSRGSRSVRSRSGGSKSRPAVRSRGSSSSRSSGSSVKRSRSSSSKGSRSGGGRSRSRGNN